MDTEVGAPKRASGNLRPRAAVQAPPMNTQLASTALFAALVGGGSAALVLALARGEDAPSASATLVELRLRRLEQLAHAERASRGADLERLRAATLEALVSDGPAEGDEGSLALSERIERALAVLGEEEAVEAQAIGRALDEALLEARLQRLCELADLDLEQAWRVRARLERR